MDFAGPLAERDERTFPWRTAALAVAAVAAAELVALLALAGVKLAPSVGHASSPPAAASPASSAAPATATSTPTVAAATTAAAASSALEWTGQTATQPLRARSHVAVLVLNGNGVTHAAGNEASRLLALGYRSATSADAPNHSYAHSLVLFAPGYEREAKRLGRDTGIAIVGPLDGLTPSQIKGSQLVVILGDS